MRSIMVLLVLWVIAFVILNTHHEETFLEWRAKEEAKMTEAELYGYRYFNNKYYKIVKNRDGNEEVKVYDYLPIINTEKD